MLGWKPHGFFHGGNPDSSLFNDHELHLDLDALRNYVDKTPLEYMQIRFRRGFDEETPIVPWVSATKNHALLLEATTNRW